MKYKEESQKLDHPLFFIFFTSVIYNPIDSKFVSIISSNSLSLKWYLMVYINYFIINKGLNKVRFSFNNCHVLLLFRSVADSCNFLRHSLHITLHTVDICNLEIIPTCAI